MAQLAVTYLNMGRRMAGKDSELLMSSPVLALLGTVENDWASQLRAGQVLERIWLTATTLGLALHPMNQILQVSELKKEVVQLIPEAGVFPQLTFRLGHAEPEGKHTLRRPLEEVLR
jgi:hypothetical protein